jgi:hypothetical protein
VAAEAYLADRGNGAHAGRSPASSGSPIWGRDTVLDETEFLSDYGVRALSRTHRQQPFVLEQDGRRLSIGYAPGESETTVFGGIRTGAAPSGYR